VAPSTTLRVVPLPRFAGEDPGQRPAATLILPRLHPDNRFAIAVGRGTAEGGGGGDLKRMSAR
jgi:hypothetical protein